jgi:hypothetical protein
LKEIFHRQNSRWNKRISAIKLQIASWGDLETREVMHENKKLWEVADIPQQQAHQDTGTSSHCAIRKPA